MTDTAETDTATPEYFAVSDPFDLDRITYWHRVKRGRNAGKLQPWPPRTSYHPLYRNDPRLIGLAPEQQREVAIEHYDAVLAAREWIEDEIDGDPEQAAARFAAFEMRCCCCGKRLTEERSKVYGIGPECRQGMSSALLDVYVEAVGRGHAEHLAADA